MPNHKCFPLKEAVALIDESSEVGEADLVVLPPSQVDELSDDEAINENDLAVVNEFPKVVAGEVEVQLGNDSDVTEDEAEIEIKADACK